MPVKVIDVCCGTRMMWHDSNDSRVLFADLRSADYSIPPDRANPKGATLRVRPDVVASFASLPFPDASFWHVVFDPPHVQRREMRGTLTKKYGVLVEGWREEIKAGFSECFRVLQENGTLIFKWSDVEIPLRQVLALTDRKPLYGHKAGKKMNTHWVAFIKDAAKEAPDGN